MLDIQLGKAQLLVMSKNVTIVDYGVGNLLSVSRAFEHVGGVVTVASDISAIVAADRLILPGVGAFGHGMRELQDRGFIPAIQEFALTNRPFLGICLGMQMMMDVSHEFGQCEGLGLIAGKVVPIPSVGADGAGHKIPHVGWNELLKGEQESWHSTILEDTDPGVSMYFVHSFAVAPTHQTSVVSHCDYNGIALAAVIQSGLHFGVQFHPEKSGPAGLKILRKFINL